MLIHESLMTAGLMNDYPALLGHLGLARADLVGYSLGAGVALQVAMRHPGRVRRPPLIAEFLGDAGG